MIVLCTKNKLSDVPEQYLSFGPDVVDSHTLACAIGKHYDVYGMRQDSKSDAVWYFTYTDSGYLWWMPAVVYEVIDDAKPLGWKTETVRGDDSLSSYPSLFDWNIEDGIIDGDEQAKKIFMADVESDDSFPNPQHVNDLNRDFYEANAREKYAQDRDNAKKYGWELPHE